MPISKSNTATKPSASATPTTKPEPTDEQRHIVSLASNTSDHIIVDALAGTGKTTTFELLADRDRAPATQLYLAFNTRNVKEAKAKLPTTEVCTLNSLGYRVWRAACFAKCVVDKDKTISLFREALTELDKNEQDQAWDEWFEIRAAVGLAKSIGYIPPNHPRSAHSLASPEELASRLSEGELSPLAWDLVNTILTSSIKQAYKGQLDFDDQIYMPALFGGAFPVYDEVYVDEASDLNACNHEMLTKFRRTRIIAVGDPRQSIYAFRGAVQGGMQRLKARFNMTEATLSLCFRCSEAIVRNVHWHAPNMRWVNPGGTVEHIDRPSADLFADGSAIICRNNAPLFRLGLHLLASGRSVSISGSEVGPKILAIMAKFGDPYMEQENVLWHIQDWLDTKLVKGSTTAPDVADCMRVFASKGATLGEALAWAKDLFAQNGSLTLLTGHKAKGLEWDTVYHLDPSLIRNDEQDLNLRYVIATRARREYYELESANIEWDSNDNLS